MNPLVGISWMHVGDLQEGIIGLELDDEHLLDGGVAAVAAADSGRLLQCEAHCLAAFALSLDTEDICDLEGHMVLLLIDEGFV